MPLSRMTVAAAALALGLTVPFAAGAQSIDAGDRDAIGAIVRDYLLENPEILLEMQQALETKQQEEMAAARSAMMEQSRDLIFDNPSDPVLGNPDGDITVVEFFDYNCGFCRRAHEDMIGLLEADRDVRFVVKEFPILGPESQQAHIVSMAFSDLMPDSYATFMDRLITADGRADEDSAIALAIELGADEATLREAMTNPSIRQRIEETYQIATALGISGTPTYIIGDEVLAGAVGLGQLRERMSELRNCEGTTC